MPRRLRVHVSGGFYHVTLRGNHQGNIFVEEFDRFLLNKIVARSLEKFGVELHAYCWMTNHLHMLMRVTKVPLAGPMRNIAAEFARAMQAKLSTTGHFFERRFLASLVGTDSYLLELERYIHLNAVRAGIVSSVGNFRWSSHHAYVGSRAEPWICTDFILRLFASERADAVAAYLEFIDAPCDDSLESIDSRFALRKLNHEEKTPDTAPATGRIRVCQCLDDLISEACSRFEIEKEALNSQLRDAYLVKVRGWIAFQANKRRVATLAAVARALSRDEATLRYAMRAYPEDIE